MKTLTAAATAMWKRKHGRRETFTVEYKRRYWNGAAYVYESSWNVLDPLEVPAPSSIVWKLDTTQQNTFLSSNVTLTMDNTAGKWTPTTSDPSVFAANDTATIGYEPYMTKFRIQFGYILDDGTSELVSLFVGYFIDFTARAGSGTISYTVKGSEVRLEQADAQNVSDAFTLENCSPATGDGTTTEFRTTSTGVWKITDVQQNAVSKTQGTQYRLSNLDETGTALITMVTAPTAGHTMKVSGSKWKASQTIEALIALLCDEAGVTSGERSISPFIVPGSTSGSKTITTLADWQAATVSTNIESSFSSGDIMRKWFLVDDFTDGDYTASPAWSLYASTSASIVTDGAQTNCLKVFGVTSTYSGAKTSFSKAYGTWRANIKVSMLTGDDFRWFVTDTSGGSHGYCLSWTIVSGVNKLRLIRYSPVYSTGTPPDPNNIIATVNSLSFSGFHEYRVTRSAAGAFEVFQDGVSVMTGTDTTYSTSNYIGVWGFPSTISASFIEIDDIYWASGVDGTGSVSTSTATFESAVQDILSTPTSWGSLTVDETLNSGTIAYYSSSSADNISYEAYALISGGVITSTLGRYFKIKAVITPYSGSFTSPVLSEIVASFAVSSVNLAIAIFKGKTCFQAIQDLAKIADYEWGFSGDGTFFFRSKDVSGDSDFTMDQDSPLIEVTQYRPGWDKIINSGQLKYGDKSQYFAQYDDDTAAATSPTSAEKFSPRIKSDTMAFLLANDVNLGTARARLLYENGKDARARLTVTVWMTPHADLADIATVSYFDDPKAEDPIFGDELQTWGNTPFGSALNLLLSGKRFKIVGVSYNIRDGSSDLDLLEII